MSLQVRKFHMIASCVAFLLLLVTSASACGWGCGNPRWSGWGYGTRPWGGNYRWNGDGCGRRAVAVVGRSCGPFSLWSEESSDSKNIISDEEISTNCYYDDEKCFDLMNHENEEIDSSTEISTSSDDSDDLSSIEYDSEMSFDDSDDTDGECDIEDADRHRWSQTCEDTDEYECDDSSQDDDDEDDNDTTDELDSEVLSDEDDNDDDSTSYECNIDDYNIWYSHHHSDIEAL